MRCREDAEVLAAARERCKRRGEDESEVRERGQCVRQRDRAARCEGDTARRCRMVEERKLI